LHKFSVKSGFFYFRPLPEDDDLDPEDLDPLWEELLLTDDPDPIDLDEEERIPEELIDLGEEERMLEEPIDRAGEEERIPEGFIDLVEREAIYEFDPVPEPRLILR
jgi:hypothetical protein